MPVILILVLIGSTSCTSTETIEDDTLFRDTLISMIPELPEVPAFPELNWTYLDGLYCLDERNVDKLLDYGENILPQFKWDLDQYQKKLEIVLQRL